MFNEFCVIVVLYNSKPKDELISFAKRSGINLIIVDNSVRRLLDVKENYIHNANLGGLAGAYNKALKHMQHENMKSKYVVFMDDDTPIEGLISSISDSETLSALSRTDVAAVSGIYRDINTNLRGRMILSRRYKNYFYSRDTKGLIEVSYLINSLCIWNADALSKIGPFNERFSVDHVDTEYCLRASSLGYKLLCNYSREFKHTIGERTVYKFLGMELQTGNHSQSRRYMIARNTTVLFSRYVFSRPAVSYLMLQRIIYEILGILHEDVARKEKIRSILAGIRDGLFDRPVK